MQFHYFDALQDYSTLWQQMQDFIAKRQPNSEDEIWFCQHQPVFTLGQAGKPEHILDAHQIPIVKSDRGGQVTYHGPGFLMVYCLLDLNQLNLNTRQLVCKLENVLIDFFKQHGISAYADRDAPGVYVDKAKIASIGLRIRKGYSYHGLCINVDGDLTPFSYINPCGIVGQQMVSLKQLGIKLTIQQVAQQLEPLFNFQK